MEEDGSWVRAVGKMGYREFFKWGKKKLAEGWQICSCYEAGASGYWLHRELIKLGIKNLVVVPKAMGQGGKKQKTDRRESCQLTDEWERELSANPTAFSGWASPRHERGEKRALRSKTSP